MPTESMPLRPTRASRRLLLLFSVTVLVPSLILGAFALQTLSQQRREAENQVRQSLSARAEDLGRRLESDFSEWQDAIEGIAGMGAKDPSKWPPRLRSIAADSGTGIVLLGTREQPKAIPETQLLYALGERQEGSPADSLALSEAEALEIIRKQHDRAIDAYRKLTASHQPSERAAALHRMARTLLKVDRVEEAVRAFEQLAKEPPVRIGLYPSDLLARFRIVQLESDRKRSQDAGPLYWDLVAGRWQLDEIVYESYSESLRQWLPARAETLEVMAEEQRKRAFTLATARFLATPQSVVAYDDAKALAFWKVEPFAAVVLNSSHLQAVVESGKDRQDFTTGVYAPNGVPLLAADEATSGPVGLYTLQNTAVPLRLLVRPKDPAAIYAGIDRQQNLYFAMLAVLVCVLGLGGYFTLHTLRSELAVAQMKSDFVSTVSHEFRSPLAGINQLGEMLRDGRVQDEQRRSEYYDMIVAETQRLRRLVENVLDFARMEEGRKQYRFETVEPAGWLKEVAEDFQAQVASRGFEVEADIPPQLPAIFADRDSLTTAVSNLLDNAVKYSGDSHIVRLEARPNNNGLSILVCDRGVGIPEDDQSRIFEKFYRANGEVTRQVKGVGLGLNLVLHIVAAHGGSIDVDSKQGEGSTFTIHLKTARRTA